MHRKLHAFWSRQTVVAVTLSEWSFYPSNFVRRPVHASDLWSPWVSGGLINVVASADVTYALKYKDDKATFYGHKSYF